MGGVLVNVGHPAAETDIFLAPQLAAVVKPHQVLNYYNINHIRYLIIIIYLLYNYYKIANATPGIFSSSDQEWVWRNCQFQQK